MTKLVDGLTYLELSDGTYPYILRRILNLDVVEQSAISIFSIRC